MFAKLVLSGVLTLACATAGAEDQAVATPRSHPTLAQAQAHYEQAVRVAHEEYVRELKDVLKVAMAGGDLVEANHVNDVIREVERGEAPSKAPVIASTGTGKALLVKVISVAKPDVNALQQQIASDQRDLARLQADLPALQKTFADMESSKREEPVVSGGRVVRRQQVNTYSQNAIAQAQENVLRNQGEQRKLKTHIAAVEKQIADANKTRIINGVLPEGSPIEVVASTPAHTALADTMEAGATFRMEGALKTSAGHSAQLILSRAVPADAP